MFRHKIITGAALLCSLIALSVTASSASAGHGFTPGGCYRPPVHCTPHGCYPRVPTHCNDYGCWPYNYGGMQMQFKKHPQQQFHFQQNFQKFNGSNFHH